LTDVERLAVLFADESKSIRAKSDTPRISYEARADDATVFETDSLEEFLSSDIFKTKRIVSIKLSLAQYSTDKRLSLSLSHGNSDYQNGASIQGNDSNWVNSIYTRLKESIDACQPQSSLLLKWRRPIEFLTAVGIGRLYIWVLDIAFSFVPFAPIENPPNWVLAMRNFFQDNPFFFSLFDYILGLPLGWLASSAIINRAERLWPSIEFQIGPPHTYLEKRRRLLLLSIFTLGIAPLTVSIIYDLIK